MNDLLYRLKYPFMCLTLCLAIACCRQKEPAAVVTDLPIVAQVNERFITADEYSFFYELSSRDETSAEKQEARVTVLNSLIDRIILAQQAEALGLADMDTTLQRALDQYKRQAVNRELYLKYVRNQVSVNIEEERTAFDRSKKTLFVQHFKSESEDKIQDIIHGIKPFKHVPMYPGIRTVDLDEHGPADVVSWNDVRDNLEDILYNLPLHNISEPVFDGSYYHIFKVVDYEQELIVRENDFHANRQSINKVLRKRKEVIAASEFIHEVMSPRNLVIRNDALGQLTDHIWAGLPSYTAPQVQYIPNEEIRLLASDEQILMQQPVAVFNDGIMTVSDFLFHYKVNPQKISYDNKEALQNSLYNAIGLYVRDWVLSEKGIEEKLDQKPSVHEEIQTRKEHMLAEKMIRLLYTEKSDEYKTDDAFNDYLKQYLNKLKEKADIQVYNEELMAVKTTDEGLSRKIDFVVVHSQ